MTGLNFLQVPDDLWDQSLGLDLPPPSARVIWIVADTDIGVFTDIGDIIVT